MLAKSQNADKKPKPKAKKRKTSTQAKEKNNTPKGNENKPKKKIIQEIEVEVTDSDVDNKSSPQALLFKKVQISTAHILTDFESEDDASEEKVAHRLDALNLAKPESPTSDDVSRDLTNLL